LAVNQLFIDFKEAHNSVRMKVLYSIFIKLGVPKKLVGLIRKVLIGKNFLRRCFSALLYNMPLRRSRKPVGTEIKRGTVASGLY
jgi:hypothetical protein